ncbi:MAG: hypothetical protein H7318_06765 [Oligoflexus sp.]|nr:hypothetical protein [Oligoflexus sp.]
MTVSAKNSIDFIARGKGALVADIPNIPTHAILSLPQALTGTVEQDAAPKKALLELNNWLDKLLIAERDSVFTRDEFDTILSILRHSGEPILKQKALSLCYQTLKTFGQPSYATDLRSYTQTLMATPRANLWEISGTLLIAGLLEPTAVLQNYCAQTIEASYFDKDGFFLRAQILEHAKTEPSILQALMETGYTLLFDRSAYVRIRALELLQLRSSPEECVVRLQKGDAHPKVQATLLQQLSSNLFRNPYLSPSLKSAFFAPSSQWENVALEMFLQKFNEDAIQAMDQGPAFTNAWRDDTKEILDHIAGQNDEGLKRLAALSLIQLELLMDDKLLRKFNKLRSTLKSSATGHSRISSAEWNDDLPYLLSVLAYSSDGFEIEEAKNMRIIRPAFHFGFSAWRFFYELFHLSTSKRQGAAHWVSRKLKGSIRIPSSLGCELVKTAVPGEPLYLTEAGGWRPFLPLLCDLYRMLFRQKIIHIYTPDGCTKVGRPQSFGGRFKAWIYLNLHFDEWSELRNWTHRSSSNPYDYIKRLRGLGYQITFTGRRSEAIEDLSIERFFREESGVTHVER